MEDAVEASTSDGVPSQDVLSQEEEDPPANSAAKYKTYNLPPDIIPYEHQVAGHGASDNKSDIGLLYHKDGYVLKHIGKPEKGKCEVKFYEDLQTSRDLESAQLRKFVPKYNGTTSYDVNGKTEKFIILDNIVTGFVEPCIMDVKIGKQTWAPDAVGSKRDKEDRKYLCKHEVGFCIPGFQVYRISTGELRKEGKDFGKKLNRHAILDILKLFLNVDSGICRQLMLQFLSYLWQILLWCRTQKKFRFFSSSILLAYDTRRLRQCLKSEGCSPSRSLSTLLDSARNISLPLGSAYGYRSCSPVNLAYSDHLSPSKDMPDGRQPSKSPMVPSSPADLAVHLSNTNLFGEDRTEFGKACRTHSLVNHNERDLKSTKEKYSFQLNDLKGTDNPENKDNWVRVKMIDFAHVFPAVNDELDTNYLEGLENFVKMFESIMYES